VTPSPLPGYPPVPDGLQEIMQVFGAFVFVERSNGLVAPEQEWVKDNIARLENVPVLNQAVVCHRRMALPISNVFQQILEAGLAAVIGHGIKCTTRSAGCPSMRGASP
jgi:hypothetical protein